MSVINTNYLALVSQNNLTRSQSALGTAIERLSSGMRINSAKDDAAGQAIANRFTANIKGLTQAGRNANDGISIAQTTEGALNEINNNLQRIRELSVQAANGSNSDTDLTSIQAEITQRLEEIDRVSQQTQFNGKKVLSDEAGSLKVQVGSRDSEMIKINLREISAATLGLSTFNIEGSVTSKSLTAITKGGEIDVSTKVEIAGNSYTPSTPGPNGPVLGLHPDGALYATTTGTGSGFVVKAEDNNFYELNHNAATDKWVWDSSTSKVDLADVDTSGPVTSLPVYDTALDGSKAVDIADLTTAVTNNGTGNNTADVDLDLTTVYALNDRENDPTGTQSFAVKDNSTGNYYVVTGSASFTGTDKSDPGDYTWTWDAIDVDVAGDLVQVSENNVNVADGAITQIAVGTFTATPDTDLYNEDLTSAPTAADLYALSDKSGYVVKTTDGEYYAADVTDPTAVTWDSSTGAISGSLVGAKVENLVTGQTNGSLSGLGTGETLHSYQDDKGVTQYVVKGTDADGRTTYTLADVNINNTTGEYTVTKQTGEEAAVTVDPLAMLDSALQNVDNLRSELGAVQNRFQSTIANLANTVNNLSAARSRIEDADYAVEVSNMTRAQILQQAGTSVLAQANQVPQTVLSLLR